MTVAWPHLLCFTYWDKLKTYMILDGGGTKSDDLLWVSCSIRNTQDCNRKEKEPNVKRGRILDLEFRIRAQFRIIFRSMCPQLIMSQLTECIDTMQNHQRLTCALQHPAQAGRVRLQGREQRERPVRSRRPMNDPYSYTPVGSWIINGIHEEVSEEKEPHHKRSETSGLVKLLRDRCCVRLHLQLIIIQDSMLLFTLCIAQ